MTAPSELSSAPPTSAWTRSLTRDARSSPFWTPSGAGAVAVVGADAAGDPAAACWPILTVNGIDRVDKEPGFTVAQVGAGGFAEGTSTPNPGVTSGATEVSPGIT